ncbi:MAG: hypothetical protein ABEH38_06595 [Flavobacteriales bacterium]
MLTLFGKKKLSEEKVANMVVNGLLEAVEKNFKDVVALINSDPDFLSSPQVDENDDHEFLLIVITGNLKFIPQYFESGQDQRVKELLITKFAQALGVEYDKLKEAIDERSAFLSRVNHPSKKTLYAMSKAVFHKYGLNDFQEDYFRRIETPNPLFLQRMDDIMVNFLWGWDAFLEKYKVQASTD